jgi:hypothetical protein
MSRRCLCIVLLALLGATAAPLESQTSSVENDAQAYTQLVLQHDRLILKNNMKRKMSEAEFAEMARLRAELQKINAKYAAGGPSRSLGTAFEKRRKELSLTVVAAAVRRWVAEEFPEPAQVAAAFSKDLERAAAMRVLAEKLNEKVGQPPSSEVGAKVRRYQEAWARINPKSRDDYTARLSAIDALVRSNQFQFDVLNRFVPLYAVEADNAVRKDQYVGGVATSKARVRSASIAVALVIVSLPLIYLFLTSRKSRQTMVRNPDEAYPFQLPKSLQWVKLFRKRLFVEYAGGKITGKDRREEKRTWTTTTPGQTREVGPWTFKDPDSTHTSTQTIVYYKYTFETPDGGSRWLEFVGSPSHLEIGTLFGIVVCGDDVLLYYDHTNDRMGRGNDLDSALAMPAAFLFWLAGMAVAVAGFTAVRKYLVDPGPLAHDSVYESIAGMLIFFTAPLLAIYIGILRSSVRKTRDGKFEKTWVPRFQKFLEDLSPLLKRHFGKGDHARVRLEKRLEKERSKP